MSERRVVSFRPLGPGRPRQARWKWLHWPALAFRVRAHVPAARRLDVFEELVLRLALAGHLTPEKIGQLSGLAPDLVTLVIGQLAQRGLVDQRGPTDRGRAAVDAEQRDDATDAVLGWMLRCQLSGQVMPLFCEGDLPSAFKQQGLPPACLPAVVKDARVEPLRDFHLGLRRWRELLLLADSSDRSDEEHDTPAFPLDADEAELRGSSDAPPEEPIERPARPGASLPPDEQHLAIEPLEGPPQPVALRVFMYLPLAPRSLPQRGRSDSGSGLDGVMVRHPFGIPGGEWYRHRLEAHMTQLGATAGELRGWARSAREQREKSLRAEGITLGDLATLGRHRAADLLGEVESLDEALAQPVALLGEALVLTEKRPDHAGELRSRTCKVLEVLYDVWICRFGDHREQPSRWAGTRVDRENHVRAAARALGVADVPAVMLDPDRDGLLRAIKGKGDLRDRMVLVLVDAATAPGQAHPLTLALRREPQLMERLDEIRRTRNRSVHYRRGQQPEHGDRDAADKVIEHVQLCLSALFTAWRDALQPNEESIPLDL